MHTEPRRSPIDMIVVHVNVGPEIEGGARSLASYLHEIDGGYHAIVDDKQTVVVAGDQTLVWGAGGVNERALHVCIIGYANQTAAQWIDPYSLAATKRAAAWVADKCKTYGIPAVRLTPAQVATPGVKGICGHCDVSAVYAASEGHYDPGPGFHWNDVFLPTLAQLLNPLAFILARPGGGAWWAHRDGSVDFIDRKGNVTHGGMIAHPRLGRRPDLRDVVAFRGRTLKKLVPRQYRRLGRRRDGYTIVATSGERYVPSTQH